MAAKLETRPYQERIVEKVVSAFTKENCSSALVHSPTGSGKTVIAYLALQAILDAGLVKRKSGVRIGWSAMRRNLLTQAETENAKFGFNLDVSYCSMFDKNPPDLDILIVDEAQHDATTSMAHFHGKSDPRFVIGLSATPWRADRVGLCFDKIVKDAGIAELIRQGYLSQYHHFTIPDFTPESVANTYLEEPRRWGKSVIYFHREEDCLDVVARLKAGGVTTELVTHRTDRETQLESFAKGRTKVIVNMMLLTEGFDSPDLKTVFIRPSVKSCTMQMGGRVFRKHASCEFKQIVQCQKTETPFLKIAPAQESFIQIGGAWLSLTPSANLEQIIAANRALLAKTKTSYVPGMFKTKKKALNLKDFDKGDDE